MPILLKHWGRLQPHRPFDATPGHRDDRDSAPRRVAGGPRSDVLGCDPGRSEVGAAPPQLSLKPASVLWHDSTLTPVNATLLRQGAHWTSQRAPYESDPPTGVVAAAVCVLVEPRTRYYYLEVSDQDWVDGAPSSLGRGLPLFRDAGVWVTSVHEPWHGLRSEAWPDACAVYGLRYVEQRGYRDPPRLTVVDEVLQAWAPFLQLGHTPS